MHKNTRLKNRFLISTALAGASFFGYGRGAYAAYSACHNTSGTSYLCDSAGVATQDFSDKDNATITTADGFSVNASSGNAITITGDGTLSFTDAYSSTISTTDLTGLYVKNGTYGSGIEINAGNATITGGSTGIYTSNNGTGETSVTAYGIVTGESNHAIYVKNGANATDLTINAGTVNGDTTGIFAYNMGAGATSITASGDVTGTRNSAIYVKNGNNATDLTINTGTNTITANFNSGIFAYNRGTGEISITAYGNLIATDDNGIYAQNSTNSSDIIINAGSVTANGYGIFAYNHGTGETSVTVQGDVVSEGNSGISVKNGANTTDITINAGTSAVMGFFSGIRAENRGTGATNITAYGDVTGQNDKGIYVTNNSNTSNLTIKVGSVTGHDYGIFTSNNGTGETSVTVLGDVISTGNGSISIRNGENATDLTVNTGTGNVTGYFKGINIYNRGTGDTTITAYGHVTGENDIAIYAKNTSNTGNLTINAGTVSGDDTGIYAYNGGTGATNITASGDVTGERSTAIRAVNGADATDLIINTGTNNVIANFNNGIVAYNRGTGETSITARGDVEGATGTGIYIKGGANATDLTVYAGNVTGETNGIYSYNMGTGKTFISVDGDVTGTTANAIYAKNSSSDYIRITTGSDSNVSGYNSGIKIINNGTDWSALGIEGSVTGQHGSGIYVNNASDSAKLILINTYSGSQVQGTGSMGAIYANNQSLYGDIQINISGDVTGITNQALIVKNANGVADIQIIGNGDGTLVQSTGMEAIKADGSTPVDMRLIGYAGQVAITGYGGTAINLGSGNDNLEINYNVTINGDIIGGGGIDIVTLRDAVLTLGGSSSFSGFDTIKVIGDSSVSNVSITPVSIDGATLKFSINDDIGTSHLSNTYGYGIEFSNGGNISIDTSDLSIGTINSGTVINIFSGGDVTGITEGEVKNNSDYFQFTSIIDEEGISLLVSDKVHSYDACHNTTGTSYLCEGTATESQDFFGKDNASVSTADGFNVTASAGNAINITGDGAISFTDTYESEITATDTSEKNANGIRMRSDENGAGLTINANSTINAYRNGIYAVNNGTGTTDINFDGNITTLEGSGIFASNANSATGLNIETGAGSNITVNAIDSYSAAGIFALIDGSSSSNSITVNGAISSSKAGIRVVNYTDNLTITTGDSSNVSGAYWGILAEQTSGGTLDINVNGEISGGVHALFANSSDVNITTGANSYILGSDKNNLAAISIEGSVSDKLTDIATANITINGDITGKNVSAVSIINYGYVTNLSINGNGDGTVVKSNTKTAIWSADASPVHISLTGINADVTLTGGNGTAMQLGSGDDTLSLILNVNINGNVIAGDGDDILEFNAANLTLDSGSSLSGFETIKITGESTINSDTALDIGDGTLKIRIDSDTDYGKLVNADGISFSDTGTVSIDAANISPITESTTIEDVFSGGTVTGLTGAVLEDNNYIYKFTSIVNSEDIDILIERDANFSSLNSDNSSIGTALDKISNEVLGSDVLQNLISVLGPLDAEILEPILKTLTPNVSGINTNTVISVADSVIDTIGNRMAPESTGISSGDEPVKKGLWGAAFGKDITQDMQDGVSGYDADSKGYVIGADGEFKEITLGAALSYADTDAEGNSSHTQVDSTQVTLYGRRDIGKLYYESLGFATINHFNSSRTLFDNSIAESSYDNYLFSAKTGIGYHANIKQLTVTPFASLQYSHIEQPDYTETGSSAPLHVEGDNFQSFKSGMGAKFEYGISKNGLNFVPHASVAWYHDFINDRVETTANFVSASPTFTTVGAKPDSDSFKLGLGLDVLNASNMTLSIDYNTELRDSFEAHTGMAKFRVNF